MSAARTYLDWNATAPLRPEARAAMLAALDLVGNPSSLHAEGRRARAIIEDAREQVAAAGGRSRPMSVFTSGGTEANNAVLARRLGRGPGGRRRARLACCSAARIPAPAHRDARRRATAWSPRRSRRRTWRRQRAAAALLIAAGGQQRDRRAAARSPRWPATPRRSAGRALRCRAGGRPHCRRIAELGADELTLSAPQARRAQGRRCAGD